MDSINKTAIRATVLIHEQLAGGTRHELPICLPEYSWNNIQQLRRQIDRARQWGWHRAARRLTEDMANALDDCRRHLESAHHTLESCNPPRHVASASDIYRDILALYDEFEDVNIDLKEHTLSVTTDPIVLEYVRLGAFEIRLDWQCLNKSSAYRVVALDPNPAAKSEDITHPHVQDEQLCEGDGRAAVQSALSQCRLHDFFVLVSQLLHTYGRGSAYVELDDWNGIPCSDCGDLIDEGSQYCCARCGSTLCGSCEMRCQDCGESYCAGCIQQCAACGSDHCSSCLATCSACHKRFCDDCLEAGLCQSCHEKQRKEEKQDGPPQNGASKRPAARPRRNRQRRPVSVPA
jgi:hypothetical protein